MVGIPARADVFPVGPPVALEHQVGRIEDISRVAEALRGRDHVVLSDARRTGKSTVALGAMDLLSAHESTPVLIAVDLRDGIHSSSQLADEIAHQVALQRSARAVALARAKRLARSLWQRTRAMPIPAEAEADEIEALQRLLRALESKKTGVERLSAALDEAQRSAVARGVDLTVFVDEAQDLARWSDAADVQRELRTRMRARARCTTCMFAGSERSMMDSLFATSGLLEFDGQNLELSPLPDEVARDDLRRSFRELHSEIADRALSNMLIAADGRPLRLMLIANKAHRIASELGLAVIEESTLGLAVREARADRLWNAVS